MCRLIAAADVVLARDGVRPGLQTAAKGFRQEAQGKVGAKACEDAAPHHGEADAPPPDGAKTDGPPLAVGRSEVIVGPSEPVDRADHRRFRVGVGTLVPGFLLFAPMAGLLAYRGDGREELAGTVLLVEDEELVRRVTTRMMAKLGFELVSCEGGREALATLDEGAEEWTLAVVDVQMPEVGGREVLARIRERYPALPVVLMTGYAGPEAEHEEPAPDAWLRKPFSMAELLEAGRLARRNREIHSMH